MGSLAPFRVYWIVDVRAAAAAVAEPPRPGVVLQLRDRMAGGRALCDVARALCKAGHRVFVNDRVDVALAAGCEGVHLGRGSLDVSDARACGVRAVGLSAHSVHDVRIARTRGADFCVLSPIFPSPGKGSPLGLEPLAAAAEIGVPVLALGGIDDSNARACFDAGAAGVAAIRAGARLARTLGR